MHLLRKYFRNGAFEVNFFLAARKNRVGVSVRDTDTLALILLIFRKFFTNLLVHTAQSFTRAVWQLYSISSRCVIVPSVEKRRAPWIIQF